MQLVSGVLSDLLGIVFWIIDIYVYIIVAVVIMSWLIAFGVVNRHQPIVQQINDVLLRLTEPVLRPIRRFMPNLGGLDISPIILIIGLQFLKQLISRVFIAIFA
jgi:YggT family protein